MNKLQEYNLTFTVQANINLKAEGKFHAILKLEKLLSEYGLNGLHTDLELFEVLDAIKAEENETHKGIF